MKSWPMVLRNMDESMTTGQIALRRWSHGASLPSEDHILSDHAPGRANRARLYGPPVPHYTPLPRRSTRRIGPEEGID